MLDHMDHVRPIVHAMCGTQNLGDPAHIDRHFLPFLYLTCEAAHITIKIDMKIDPSEDKHHAG